MAQKEIKNIKAFMKKVNLIALLDSSEYLDDCLHVDEIVSKLKNGEYKVAEHNANLVFFIDGEIRTLNKHDLLLYLDEVTKELI